MMFNIEINDHLLVLTRDRKKTIWRLIGLCIFIVVGFVGVMIDDYYHDRVNPIPTIMLFATMSLFLFSTVREYIRSILYGEVLTFDRKKGEFRINNYLQKRLDELLRIELYHHSGDDKDYTYLDIIYTDNTYHRLDYVSMYENEELVELGSRLGSFLNIPIIERHNHNQKNKSCSQ
jgi:hypothetical protein